MTARLRLIAAPLAAALTLVGCSSAGTATPSTSSTSRAPEVTCSSGKAPSYGGDTAAFDSPVPVESTSALTAQVSEPTLSSAPAPAEGLRIAQVKVNARVVTNGVFAMHPEAFVLADPSGALCPQPAKNPLRDGLQVAQVDESHSAVGTLAFVVPAEANLSNYTVYYLAQPGAPKAVAAWSGEGSAPSTAAATTTCSANRSGIKLDGAKDQPFGKPFSTGDNTISLEVTPSTPWGRALEPGQNQPNDVSGVVVGLDVTAKGAVGFVERNQFQLLDDKGNLCRYNELGSDGETLTSTLVDPGKPRRFYLVFWTPKGSEVAGWKLLYLPEPSDKKVVATWTVNRSATSPTASSPATSSPATSSPATSSSVSAPAPTK
ncbi:hypothetical protein [Calidifontibacter indicus]|uniref:Uncharacterized protein n=1 Tax=Calidifontibacter indicus TaxID=419650 RepID=A0A3D9UYS8_9MICO|nr:hypothetical protein [Calidifontibacter indicus]REF31755.1 hypothetical protein DFJ65_2836 [Calidifontibacter indicus]